MKFIYLLGAFALTFSFSSCNQQPKEQAVVVESKNEKTEVIREKQVETPAKKVEVEKVVVAPKEKETSISVSPTGGTLKTKKVDIQINK